MKVHVLLLAENTPRTARTTRDLDAQRLPYGEFCTTIVLPDTVDPGTRSWAQDLTTRRPNLTVCSAPGGRWGRAVRSALSSDAEHVLILVSGTGMYRHALPSLLAAARGHDVVVGRQAGRPTWGGAEGRGPIAAALVPRSRALVAEPGVEGGSAQTWLDAWHEAVLEGAPVTTSSTTPVVRASRELPDDLQVERADASWSGRRLEVEATLTNAVSTLEPGLVLRAADGTELPLPTSTQRDHGHVRLTALIDPGAAADGQALPDGTWAVEVQADTPGRLWRGRVPKVALVPAVIDDRPVMAAQRTDDLRLQVGTVRRNYLRVRAEDAVLTESAHGTLMSVPVAPLHVADSRCLGGAVDTGRLTVPAKLLLADGAPRLEVLLSGLAGDYRLSASFGHASPVSMGVTLHVDGSGRMTLSPTVPRRPTGVKRSVPEGSGTSHHVARLVAALESTGRRGTRRVRSWFANRAR